VILYGNPIVAVTDVTEDSRLIEDSTTVSRYGVTDIPSAFSAVTTIL
jgi:hypothetical protein